MWAGGGTSAAAAAITGAPWRRALANSNTAWGHSRSGYEKEAPLRDGSRGDSSGLARSASSALWECSRPIVEGRPATGLRLQ